MSFELFLRIRPPRIGGGVEQISGTDKLDSLKVVITTTPTSPRAGQEVIVDALVVDKNGKPLTGAMVTAEADMQTMSMGVRSTRFTESGVGHYHCRMRFSMAGIWRVNLTIGLPCERKPLRRSTSVQVGE
jgi:hypothetical protein